MGSGDVACVVLADPAVSGPAGSMVYTTNKVIVVRVDRLKKDAPDDEMFARRIERHAIRGIGMCFGLSDCPNQRCAMWAMPDPRLMDRMGRNLCPPDLVRFEKAAKNRGMEPLGVLDRGAGKPGPP
jgi:predicted Zn-dependent protease